MDMLAEATSKAFRLDDEDWKCPVCGAGYEDGRGFVVESSAFPDVDMLTLDDELFCSKCHARMYGADLVKALNEKMPNSAQTAEQVDKVYVLAMAFVNAVEATNTCGALLSTLIDVAQNMRDAPLEDSAWARVGQMENVRHLHVDIAEMYAERLADYCRRQKLV